MADGYLQQNIEKKGCTDPNATNYQPEAKKNNKSCIYEPGINLIGADTVRVPLKGSYFDEGVSAIETDGTKQIVIFQVENLEGVNIKKNMQ